MLKTSLDVKSAYPYGQFVFNLARETTVAEMVAARNISRLTLKKNVLNMIGGTTNAIEVMQDMGGLPTLKTIDDLFCEEHDVF